MCLQPKYALKSAHILQIAALLGLQEEVQLKSLDIRPKVTFRCHAKHADNWDLVQIRLMYCSVWRG